MDAMEINWILVLLIEIAIAVIFYLLGHGFGVTEGYRKARKEFDTVINEMREEEKELEEEFQNLKRQIGGIEKLAMNLDDGK